jgi:hypothetical protein
VQVNDPQRLRAFLQTVADRHGIGALKMSRSVLSGILGFAINNGTLATNALRQIRAVKAQTVKTPARERDTTRALTKNEREAVIAYADKLTLSETINPRTRR